ncbi:MAG: helix-turn-helix domain-containing protein [Chitinivibrionales bacterium]|nr:helix-turn-helix domain-containing protein [Chitinivibrionales bacterium]
MGYLSRGCRIKMTLYGTKEAGAVLGLSRETVKWYCRTHGIGSKAGATWVLTEADLDVIRRHMAEGPGPKPKRA